MTFRTGELLFAAAALLCAGCASFEAERTSRFVDDSGRFVQVEYARGDYYETEFTAPNGVRMPFKSKLRVRVTLWDGTRFVAYQNMSFDGILYKTDDAEWEFFEQGTGCAVAHMHEDGDGYVLVFSGIMCMNGRNVEKKPKITGSRSSSTPRVSGRDSGALRESSGSRAVERNGGKD